MEGTRGGRRMVQSTLFPRRESSIKVGDNCNANQFLDGDVSKPENVEDEMECGSSQKRKQTKRKSNSRAETTPCKKVIEKCEGTSSQQVDDADSPIIVKANFFAKASVKRQNKSQQDQQILIDSPEENDEICTPPISVANGRSTPRKSKRQNNSTPNKERTNSTPKKKLKSCTRPLCSKSMSFDLTLDEQTSQTIPDLRLEAKLTAEENSRIFAGRQIHPFFASRKTGKTVQDLTDFETTFQTKERGITFNPIHVFEDLEDDDATLDWSDWVFSEKCFSGGLEYEFSPVYEGSINSLNFDNFPSVANFTRTALYQESHQCSIQQREVTVMCIENEKDANIIFDDKKEMLATAVELQLPDHTIGKNDFFGENCSSGNSKSELQDELLQERVISHYHTCHNQPENCLWTDKYQPQNAKQVCGNGEPVKFLSEWLQLWQKKGSVTSKSSISDYKYFEEDVNYDSQQSDYDSDTIDVEDSLKNVMLIMGPVGSGKSAAIYACAKECGFQIIEINASEWRNGALIKQKFGEAVESHWLQRTVENPANSDSKSLSKLFSSVITEKTCSENEVDLTPSPEKENSRNAGASQNNSIFEKNIIANHANEIKTLILFEDVDANLCEDQGFISTIQQLAETAKRPMILTSNSYSPVLPKNLDRSELNFSVPPLEDLLGLVRAICAAEKIKMHPCLVERFVDYCQGDIRKTIMILQFWCQGQTPGRENKFRTTYRPVLFDLDAAHKILPQMIPSGYPSQLSEFIEKELNESLSLTEETPIEVENTHFHTSELDPFEAKKEAMLRLNSSFQDEVRFDLNRPICDSSCSPVASARQNRRKNIILSDSEDEFLVETTNQIDLNLPAPDFLYHQETVQINDSHVQNLEETFFQLPEDSCKSPDISHVPSFVPESELIRESDLYSVTVSCGLLADVSRASFISPDSNSITMFDKSLHITPNSDQETLTNYQEEVGDSLSKCEVDVPIRYQVLDECSCVDFMRVFKSLDNMKADRVLDPVQETWNRLRNERNEFKKYVTGEEKDACGVLKFTLGASNLISEADILLKDCQTLLYDFPIPLTNTSEKLHSFNYYDDQLEMSSILAQHGMCFYAEQIASLESITGPTMSFDLASEMLSSSESSIALGKLAGQERSNKSENKTHKTSKRLMSKLDSCFYDLLQSIVPSRSYLAVKGDAFHEYLSTLSQISRFENSRLSESSGNKRQRRGRVTQHYLSSSSLSMSAEEISLLSEYNCKYPSSSQ